MPEDVEDLDPDEVGLDGYGGEPGPELGVDQMTDIIDRFQSRIDALDHEQDDTQSAVEFQLSAALSTEGVSLEDLLADGFEMDAQGSHRYWINQETREMFESDQEISITDQVSAQYRERHEETIGELMQGNIVVQHYRVETQDQVTEGYTFQMMDAKGNVSTFSLKKVTAKEGVEVEADDDHDFDTDIRGIWEVDDDESDDPLVEPRIEIFLLSSSGLPVPLAGTRGSRNVADRGFPTTAVGGAPHAAVVRSGMTNGEVSNSQLITKPKEPETIHAVRAGVNTHIEQSVVMEKTAVRLAQPIIATKRDVVDVSRFDGIEYDNDVDVETRLYPERTSWVEPTTEPTITVSPPTSIELYGIGIDDDDTVIDVQEPEHVSWSNVFSIGEPTETVVQLVSVNNQEGESKRSTVSTTERVETQIPTTLEPVGFWSSQDDKVSERPDFSPIQESQPSNTNLSVVVRDNHHTTVHDRFLDIRVPLEASLSGSDSQSRPATELAASQDDSILDRFPPEADRRTARDDGDRKSSIDSESNFGGQLEDDEVISDETAPTNHDVKNDPAYPERLVSTVEGAQHIQYTVAEMTQPRVDVDEAHEQDVSESLQDSNKVEEVPMMRLNPEVVTIQNDVVEYDQKGEIKENKPELEEIEVVREVKKTVTIPMERSKEAPITKEHSMEAPVKTISGRSSRIDLAARSVGTFKPKEIPNEAHHRSMAVVPERENVGIEIFRDNEEHPIAARKTSNLPQTSVQFQNPVEGLPNTLLQRSGGASYDDQDEFAGISIAQAEYEYAQA